MQDEPSYEDMSLKEFIQEPNVIQMYARYNANLENQLRDKPYARIGEVVRGNYAIIYIDSRRISELQEILGTAFVESFPNALGLLGRASLEASTITQVQQQPFLDLRGSGVLIGIIDTGIDYTKKAFQYEDGTSKIRYIWDQTIEGNSPDGFLSGSEYTQSQINQALQSDYPYDVVPSRDTVRTWNIFSICCRTVVKSSRIWVLLQIVSLLL